MLPNSPLWLTHYVSYLSFEVSSLPFKSLSLATNKDEQNEHLLKWVDPLQEMWRQCGISLHMLKGTIMRLSYMPLTGLTAAIKVVLFWFSPWKVQSSAQPHFRPMTGPKSIWLCWCMLENDKGKWLIQECYLGSIFSAASFRQKAKSLSTRHVGFERKKERNNMPWVAVSVPVTWTIWTEHEEFQGDAPTTGVKSKVRL